MNTVMNEINELQPGKPLIHFLETEEGDKLMVVVLKLKKAKPVVEQPQAGGDLNIFVNEDMGGGDGLVH